MENVLKISVLVIALAVLFTACQEEVTPGKDLRLNQSAQGFATNNSCGDPFVDTVNIGTSPDVNGNVYIDADISDTLYSDNLYYLHNYYRITDGDTLVIQAGTVIYGVGGTTPGTLVIERGGVLIAEGTSTCPIVFTSQHVDPSSGQSPAPGDWGGIVVLGKAPVNRSATSVPGTSNGVAAIEGLPTPNNTGLYGGTDPSDNSGILKYVRIEYAGDVIGTDNELNGLTMGGVGNGTTLSYVQVSYGEDDGFEFFGGTVNGDHLIANRNGDDDFDTDQGYSGSLQFGVVIRDPNGNWLSSAPLNGSETNGDDGDAYQGRSNYTRAQLSNFTIVGPYQNDCGETIDANYVAGINYRDGSMQDLYNSVIMGFPRGIEIEYDIADWLGTDATSNDDSIDVRNVFIVTPNEGSPEATHNVYSGLNFNTTFDAISGNAIYAANSCAAHPSPAINRMNDLVGLSTSAWNAIDDTAPDMRPVAGSPLLGAASFSGLTSLADFNTTVTYVGAFDQTTNWMSGWTSWDSGL